MRRTHNFYRNTENWPSKQYQCVITTVTLILASLWRKAGLKLKRPQSLESTCDLEGEAGAEVVVVVVVADVVVRPPGDVAARL